MMLWRNLLVAMHQYECSTSDRSRSVGSTAAMDDSSRPSATCFDTRGKSLAPRRSPTVQGVALNSQGQQRAMDISPMTSVRRGKLQSDPENIMDKTPVHRAKATSIDPILPSKDANALIFGATYLL